MHSSLSILVNAPAEAVFALARDVSRWAEVLPHYRRSAAVAQRNERVLVHFIATRPLGRLGIPVTWRAVCWPDASDPTDLQLHFAHTRGVTMGMRVTWHIRPGEEAGTEITIEHDFARSLPIVGPERIPQLVDRFFTRPIADRTLRRFKELAESAAPGAQDPEAPSATKTLA